MKLIFHETAWEDYLYWQANDKKLLVRVNTLINDCQSPSYSGIGKPEPLRGSLSGWWSRRINKEHRLVYRIESDNLLIAHCRYH